MKRYEPFFVDYIEGLPVVDMKEHPYGDWVKYDVIRSLLVRLNHLEDWVAGDSIVTEDTTVSQMEYRMENIRLEIINILQSLW